MKKHYLGLILIGSLYFTMACQPKTGESSATEGQEQSEEKANGQRPSPLIKAEGQAASKSIKVQYGSPAVKGRTIWGDLVPYNVVWRTGANEATYVELAEAVTVEGKTLAAGKYSIFSIPKESGAWTVIFNSDWNLEHGHFQYNEKNDILRVEVQPQWEPTSQESLSIAVESQGIVIRWEKLKLPIAMQ
ncbi:MAG: DUF2911 domain-containing protein [Bacteroidetes bacterium]|nr:DUF2911 domain-containing protein [Bacteroidota bacterium]MDA1268761.1 DUF2911 domain-containing protein [Bacteroidota bacterium]